MEAALGKFNVLDQEFRKKDLEQARMTLQKVREAAFERLPEPPPAY